MSIDIQMEHLVGKMSVIDHRDTRPRKERTANADRRRSQLIEATLRSIVSNGLSKTTLATVAREADLSQGVAVFYYKTKDALLEAALRAHYGAYYENWREDLDRAGDDPIARLTALVRADFSETVCNRAALTVWHAFWGEANAHPLYAEISENFDVLRMSEMQSTCAMLLPGASRSEVSMLASGIESLTDGLWLRMYLAPSEIDAERATAITFTFLKSIFPSHAVNLP